jgi:RNA polymerase sigma-70 factor (ECF subfamily)
VTSNTVLMERPVSSARDAETAAASSRAESDDQQERWRVLFGRLAAGDRDALAELYDLSSDRLFGLAVWRAGNRADAEEVVQEVFVRLAERRGELGRVRDPLRWLLTVTHRAAIDAARRRSVRTAEPIDECTYLTAPENEPERALDGARASALLARLPAPQREVLYLKHFAGCTHRTIARIVGAPLFTVASRYRLGIARLRKLLEENR